MQHMGLAIVSASPQIRGGDLDDKRAGHTEPMASTNTNARKDNNAFRSEALGEGD